MANQLLLFATDKMQCDDRFRRTETAGETFAPDFAPQMTPNQMPAPGVFGEEYMTDCTGEFPVD